MAMGDMAMRDYWRARVGWESTAKRVHAKPMVGLPAGVGLARGRYAVELRTEGNTARVSQRPEVRRVRVEGATPGKCTYLGAGLEAGSGSAAPGGLGTADSSPMLAVVHLDGNAAGAPVSRVVGGWDSVGRCCSKMSCRCWQRWVGQRKGPEGPSCICR